jgi:DNA repair exonuclease SbcCD ATPase subunit
MLGNSFDTGEDNFFFDGQPLIPSSENTVSSRNGFLTNVGMDSTLSGEISPILLKKSADDGFPLTNPLDCNFDNFQGGEKRILEKGYGTNVKSKKKQKLVHIPREEIMNLVKQSLQGQKLIIDKIRKREEEVTRKESELSEKSNYKELFIKKYRDQENENKKKLQAANENVSSLQRELAEKIQDLKNQKNNFQGQIDKIQRDAKQALEDQRQKETEVEQAKADLAMKNQQLEKKMEQIQRISDQSKSAVVQMQNRLDAIVKIIFAQNKCDVL